MIDPSELEYDFEVICQKCGSGLEWSQVGSIFKVSPCVDCMEEAKESEENPTEDFKTMKPDWKDAPEWANWLAIDEDYSWCWYEEKPMISESNDHWIRSDGDWEFCNCNSWKDSLEQRPSSRGQENDEDGLVWEDMGVNVFNHREFNANENGFEFSMIKFGSGNITLICQSNCDQEYFQHETFNNIKSFRKAKALAQKWLEENR